MKRVMIIAALTLTTITVQAQTSVSRLMRRCKHSPKAEYVHVSKMMMLLVRAITTNDADDYSEYIRHINSIKILDMEDCSKVVEQQLLKNVVRLKTVGCERLMAAREADEQTIVMVKKSKTRIRGLVIIDSGDDDVALIQILGNIRNSEIQKVLAEEKKK